MLLASSTALLEGFNVRESLGFIEEHIDRQVRDELGYLTNWGVLQNPCQLPFDFFLFMEAGLPH